MTSALSSFLPPITNQPAPAPAPAPAAPSRQNEFARMLSQRQAQAAAAKPAEAPQAPEAQKTAEPEAPADAQKAHQATRERAAANRADKPRAENAHDPAKAEAKKGDKASDADKAAKTAKADEAEDGEATLDPALADWMSKLNLPQTPPAAAAKTGGRFGADTKAEAGTDPLAGLDDAASGKRPGRPGDTGAAGALRADKNPAATPLAADASAKAAESASAWQAAAEHAALPVEASAKESTPAVGSMGALAGASAAARNAEAAPAAVVNVPTPVNSPEFAQSLGVQVSLLAKEGVQEAKLHLNPAEMGPISVQISIDGTQAQVDFGADSAATRQIIESGLPELASALRDAGLTLSGGSVNQQASSSGQQGEGSGSGNRGGREASNGVTDGTETAPRHSTARVSAGGVDLYA